MQEEINEKMVYKCLKYRQYCLYANKTPHNFKNGDSCDLKSNYSNKINYVMNR